MAYKDSLIPGPLDDGKQKEKKQILSERISPVDFDNVNDVGDLVESFQSASIQARNLDTLMRELAATLPTERFDALSDLQAAWVVQMVRGCQWELSLIHI